jgi:hypothetical protein
MSDKDRQVSVDKEYDFVTSQIAKHIERSVDAFKMYAQLFSAIVGGSIWLSIQSNVAPNAVKLYASLADILVGLVTLIAAIMIFENYRAWRGYRRAQCELVSHVPPPRWKSETTGWAMILCMVLGAILFCSFNPFVLHKS